MSPNDCEEFMKGFTDAAATSKEKLEYAQCVNDNVYLVQSHSESIYENKPLMFVLIFVIIALLSIIINYYSRKQNKHKGNHDKNS